MGRFNNKTADASNSASEDSELTLTGESLPLKLILRPAKQDAKGNT
jgi:hypothetical protein